MLDRKPTRRKVVGGGLLIKEKEKKAVGERGSSLTRLVTFLTLGSHVGPVYLWQHYTLKRRKGSLVGPESKDRIFVKAMRLLERVDRDEPLLVDACTVNMGSPYPICYCYC